MNKAIGLLFFGLFGFACTNEPAKVKLFANKNELNQEKAYSVEILYTDSAHIKTKVKAPLVVRVSYPESYTEMPKGLTAEFFNYLEQPNAFLKADYGKRSPFRQTMVVKGHVLVVNEKGDSLNTDQLTWYENDDRLFTDKAVRIKTKSELIFGDGLESNQDFSRYKILNVKGIVSLSK